LVFDILEHKFHSLYDPLSIIPLNLTIIELLHVIMFLTREPQLLRLIPRPLMLYDSEAAHHVNRPPLVDIQTVPLVVALNEVKHPGEHGQVLHFTEDPHKIIPFYRESRVKFSLCIETMHHLLILIDEAFDIALNMVSRNVF